MHDQLKHHFESLKFKMQKSLIGFIMDIDRRKSVNLNKTNTLSWRKDKQYRTKTTNKSTLSHLDCKIT